MKSPDCESLTFVRGVPAHTFACAVAYWALLSRPTSCIERYSPLRMSDKGTFDEGACVLRCAYCLRDGKEMVDPRQLSCSHSFCFNCLQEAMFSKQNTDVFTCPLCIKHHDLFSIGGVDSLPSCSNVVQKEGLSGQAGMALWCLLCADQGIKRAAVSFCTKCETLFCVWHDRVHVEAHNYASSVVKHELISVEIYCKSKAKFSSKFCSHHPDNKLDAMCINCNQFNCNICRSFHDECQAGNQHKNKPLKDLVGETAAKLAVAMEPALQLIKDQQELLIQSNRMTEQNVEELDQMLLNVDRVMENQLEEIRSNYSQLKTRINALRDENIKRKNIYQGEAQEKIRMLQNLVEDVKTSLDTKHPVDVIQGGAALCENLTESKNAELVSLELANMELRPAERSRSIELKFGSAADFKSQLEIENEENSALETKLAVAEARIQDEISKAKALEEKYLPEIKQLEASLGKEKEENSALKTKLTVAEAKIQDETSKAEALEEKYLLEIKQLKASLRREKVENNKKPSVALKKVPVKQTAYCVSHTADGQLVVGRNGGFDFLDESGKILRSVETPGGDISGLLLYKGHVYVIHKAEQYGPERQVQKYSRQGELLTSWKVLDYKFISQLAVVQDRVYTRSDGNNLLLAYGLTGEQQPEHNIPLPAVPRPNYLCAAPPDGLIISDLGNHLVAKYSTSGVQVWAYKGLKKPKGAFIDKLNRVWVAGDDSRIHILSPEGKFICELTVPDVKKLWQLSISGDQLASAAHTDGLLLYSVEY